MARRKQLKGVAGNLAQWCLSRNFDYKGYWALGVLYEHAELVSSNEVVIDLIDDFVSNDALGVKFSEAIQLLSRILKRDMESPKLPDSWAKDVKVVFKFNTEYQHMYHFWGSGLGGKPFMCIVSITTDQGSTYTKECGCNVWLHNPVKARGPQ